MLPWMKPAFGNRVKSAPPDPVTSAYSKRDALREHCVHVVQPGAVMQGSWRPERDDRTDPAGRFHDTRVEELAQPVLRLALNGMSRQVLVLNHHGLRARLNHQNVRLSLAALKRALVLAVNPPPRSHAAQQRCDASVELAFYYGHVATSETQSNVGSPALHVSGKPALLVNEPAAAHRRRVRRPRSRAAIRLRRPPLLPHRLPRRTLQVRRHGRHRVS